jgi:uncharacterized protein
MVRLFFATDIHGSEKCFLKFVNAWKHYPVQVLVLGGDMTGKGIVPIIKEASGHFTADFQGESYDLTVEGEIAELEKAIRFNSFYPCRMSREEYLALEASKPARDRLFAQVIVEQVARWEQLAEERLKGSGVACYLMPGNDDIRDIDAVLNQGTAMVNADDKVIEVAPGWVMLSAGYSNHTPWHGPREYDEDEITRRVDAMAARAPAGARMIFNFHCPPHNSNLDTVQLVDKDFRPRFDGMQPVMGPAGSTAVRQAFERYQPALGLHGHIHESKGWHKIGKSVAINPGSEYASGFLKGVIVALDKSKVDAHMFTSG